MGIVLIFYSKNNWEKNGSFQQFKRAFEVFYIGQILRYYDVHHNYLMDVEILKFFIRYHRKTNIPYLKVQVRFLDGFKTHIDSFSATEFLGIFFTNKIISHFS